MTLARLGGGRLVGGRYVLEAPIGRGGMGEVWRARHVALGSPVAIKFVHAASAESDSSRRRFLTEAQVTANLRTRHAVRVFDFGVTEDGLPYLVMELLEGDTLAQRITRRGRLPVDETARVLEKAARALARAHQLGIVHRDFKPENVMLVADEEEGELGGEHVKVLDFGVAKLVGALDDSLHRTLASEGGERSPSSFSVSSTGLGTPYYMAPEQVQGGARLGPAADIWAFGVVAYECLTGKRPFAGENVSELLLRVLLAKPPPAASSLFDDVPESFEAWFATACARDPARRFPSIQAAAAALGAALSPPVIEPAEPAIAEAPRAARPRLRAPRVALIAAVAASLSGLALHDGPTRAEVEAPPVDRRSQAEAPPPAPFEAPSASAADAPGAPPSATAVTPVLTTATARARPIPARSPARRLPPLGL